MKKSVVALLALLILLASGCTGGKQPAPVSQGPQPVRIGYVNLLQFAPAIVAEQKQLFTKHGLEATVTGFPNGPAVFKALGAREIDIAYAGVPAAAAWASRGLPIRVIAKVSAGKFSLITRADTGIQSPSDLKGKKVAAPGKGSGGDLILRGIILKEAGLKPGEDVTVVDAKSPNMEQLLETKQVDAIFVGEPFATFALLRGKRPVLFTPDPALVLIARNEVIAERPEVIRRVIRAHAEAIQTLNQSQEETNNLLAEHFKLPEIDGTAPEKVIAEARDRSKWEYQIGEEDRKLFTRFITVGRELGTVESDISLDQLLDLRFLGEVK